MRREATGPYEDSATAGQTVRAFVPDPLPPEPPVFPLTMWWRSPAMWSGWRMA